MSVNNALSVNVLNAPSKRHRAAKWIRHAYVVCKRCTSDQNTYRLKAREGKNILYVNGKKEQDGNTYIR